MSKINFYTTTLQYLNDWYIWDSDFSKRICSSNIDEQMTGFSDAARYYKVSRSLAGLNEKGKLKKACKILNSIPRPNIQNVCSAVQSLATKYKKEFKANTISAPSKLLWLKYRNPIIIYDSRAIKALSNKGYKLKVADYGSYTAAWLKEYEKNKQEITDACDSLTNVCGSNIFLDAYGLTANRLTKDLSSIWFKHRVFDKYLWFHGS